jgi:hypothetical protein
MESETLFAKTPATLDELRLRVFYALQRHPLCRNVEFDVVSTPRTRRGSNWTVSLQSVEPRALFEASDIVAEIQDAYDLAAGFNRSSSDVENEPTAALPHPWRG